MPTNFSRSVNPNLVRIKNGKPCSLKRHFKGCLRQVIGFLDWLANKDPDRLVWPSVEAVRKRCKQQNGTLYSTRMVELALKALREKGILSHNHAVELQERRGFIIENAYVVAPHSALTVNVGNTCCRFVGWGMVPGTTWGVTKNDRWFINRKGEVTVKPTIIFEAGPGVEGVKQ